MTFGCTIAGTPRTVQAGSLRIGLTFNERAQLSADVYSSDGSWRPSLGDEIVITQNSVTLFGGYISSAIERGKDSKPVPKIVTTITADDYNDIIGRRLITGDRPSETLKARLQWLVDTFWDDYGVSLDSGQPTGDTLESASYGRRDGWELLAEIAKLAGDWSATIDADKKLKVFDPSGVSSPYNVAVGDGHVIGDMTVEPARQGSATFVTVRAGSAGTFGKSDTFTGNGSLSSFTLRYPFVSGRGYVSVSTGGAHTETLGVGAQWTVSGNVLTRNAGALPNGDTVTIIYDAQFPIYVTADAGVSPSDRVDVLVDKPDIYDVDEAQAVADAELDARQAMQRTIRYASRTPGLAPGQTQTIIVADRNLNVSAVITEVIISNDAGQNALQFAVTAVAAGSLQTWKQVLKGSVGSGGAARTSLIGGGIAITTGASATDGNLLAQRDTDNEVEVGLIDGLTGIDVPVPGVRLGRRPGASGNHAWDLLNRISNDARYRELAFFDNYMGDGNGVAMALFYWSALGGYVLGPSSRSSAFTGGLQLGLDSLGKRIVAGYFQGEVATIAGLRERGRTAKLGEWTTYTPTFVAAGGSPTIGSGGTIAGRYAEIGKTTLVYAKVTLGTSFSFGTGNVGVSLPVAGNVANRGSWTAFATDTGTAGYPLVGIGTSIGGALCAAFQQWASPLAGITTTAPFTFGAGDVLEIMGSYEES
jgi:hypothetical protein